MRFSKKIIAAAGLLVASIAGVGIAVAHEGGAKGTREERRAEMLAKYDTNKDGKLDENERKAMREDFAVQRFKKLDTNGDGVISLDEFKAGAKMMGHGGFRHHHGAKGEAGESK